MLRTIICVLVGHRWGPWAVVGVMMDGHETSLVVDARYCERCERTEMGDLRPAGSPRDPETT